MARWRLVERWRFPADVLGWVGEHNGLSLHAGVSFGALDRKGREKLVRCCTRPPISVERLSVLSDGSIAYQPPSSNPADALPRSSRSALELASADRAGLVALPWRL